MFHDQKQLFPEVLHKKLEKGGRNIHYYIKKCDHMHGLVQLCNEYVACFHMINVQQKSDFHCDSWWFSTHMAHCCPKAKEKCLNESERNEQVQKSDPKCCIPTGYVIWYYESCITPSLKCKRSWFTTVLTTGTQLTTNCFLCVRWQHSCWFCCMGVYGTEMW